MNEELLDIKMPQCCYCYDAEDKHRMVNCSTCGSFMCYGHYSRCEECGDRFCGTCLKEHSESGNCWGLVKSQKMEKKIDSLAKQVAEIKTIMEDMRESLTNLLYAPNGPLYQEAKSDFEKRVEDNYKN